MALPFGLTLAEAITVLKPLVIFVVGMVIYSILIYHFYRFLARRDPIALDLTRFRESQHSALSRIFRVFIYLLENILFVPIFTFLWFAFLTIIIAFMAKEQAAQNIILVSMGFVAAVRITAYHNEDLSLDLAKVLPFMLLVLFVTDLPSYTYAGFIETLGSILSNWRILVYYLAFAVVLEIVLNIVYQILSPPHKHGLEDS